MNEIQKYNKIETSQNTTVSTYFKGVGSKLNNVKKNTNII
jgi:hypothetical protein